MGNVERIALLSHGLAELHVRAIAVQRECKQLGERLADMRKLAQAQRKAIDELGELLAIDESTIA